MSLFGDFLCAVCTRYQMNNAYQKFKSALSLVSINIWNKRYELLFLLIYQLLITIYQAVNENSVNSGNLFELKLDNLMKKSSKRVLFVVCPYHKPFVVILVIVSLSKLASYYLSYPSLLACLLKNFHLASKTITYFCFYTESPRSKSTFPSVVILATFQS